MTANDLAQLEHDKAIWKSMALAALDNLHDAECLIQKQRETIAEMREERRRLAVSLFGAPQ